MKLDMNTKGMSFNMFSPSQETSSSSSSSSSSSDITNDSSIKRCTRKHLDEIEKRTQGSNSAFVLSDAMHIFTIGCLRFFGFCRFGADFDVNFDVDFRFAIIP